jgi:hypothetical protein
MTAPTGFQERLRAELLHVVNERQEHPAPGRRKLHGLFASAGLMAVAAAAVAFAMSASGPIEPTGPSGPAPTVDQVGYSVKQVPNGLVQVALTSPQGAAGLQRALNAVGIPAVVIEKTRDCTEAPPIPVDWDPSAFMPSAEDIAALDIGEHGSSGVFLRPAALPANSYLLVSYMPGQENLGISFRPVWTPPTCLAPDHNDRPGHVPTRTS